MTRFQDLLSLAVAPICSAVFAGSIFLRRDLIYVRWAKIVAILALVAGLGFGAVGLVLLDWRSHHLTRDSYYALVGLRGMLAGIAIGFTLSVFIARPYVKRKVETRPDRPGC
jgi:Na+/H+ antiporter NhaA